VLSQDGTRPSQLKSCYIVLNEHDCRMSVLIGPTCDKLCVYVVRISGLILVLFNDDLSAGKVIIHVNVVGSS
jgi:hypothetical protein